MKKVKIQKYIAVLILITASIFLSGCGGGKSGILQNIESTTNVSTTASTQKISEALSLLAGSASLNEAINKLNDIIATDPDNPKANAALGIAELLDTVNSTKTTLESLDQTEPTALSRGYLKADSGSVQTITDMVIEIKERLNNIITHLEKIRPLPEFYLELDKSFLDRLSFLDENIGSKVTLPEEKFYFDKGDLLVILAASEILRGVASFFLAYDFSALENQISNSETKEVDLLNLPAMPLKPEGSNLFSEFKNYLYKAVEHLEEAVTYKLSKKSINEKTIITVPDTEIDTLKHEVLPFLKQLKHTFSSRSNLRIPFSNIAIVINGLDFFKKPKEDFREYLPAFRKNNMGDVEPVYPITFGGLLDF